MQLSALSPGSLLQPAGPWVWGASRASSPVLLNDGGAVRPWAFQDLLSVLCALMDSRNSSSQNPRDSCAELVLSRLSPHPRRRSQTLGDA